jgi:hypothetical protein
MLPIHPIGPDLTYLLLNLMNLHNWSQKPTKISENALKIQVYLANERGLQWAIF